MSRFPTNYKLAWYRVPPAGGFAPLLLAVFFVLMIKRATKSDLTEIIKLIEIGSQDGQVLMRPVDEIAQFITGFFVYIENGTVVGCCALDIYSKKLAEVRSLTVHPEFQNKGIGGKLIQRCVEEARGAGIYEILAVTDKQKLFEKVGFRTKLSNNKQPLLIKL